MVSEKRLIDASQVYEDLRKSYEELKRIRETLTSHEDIQICNAQLATYKEAMQCIKDTPTVDAVEVVHGRWVDVNGRAYLGSYCCHCNKWCDYKYNYCPNCGAKMDGGNDDG